MFFSTLLLLTAAATGDLAVFAIFVAFAITGAGTIQLLGGISIRQGGTRFIPACSLLALFQTAFSLFGCAWGIVILILASAGSILGILPLMFFGFAAYVFIRMHQSLGRVSEISSMDPGGAGSLPRAVETL